MAAGEGQTATRLCALLSVFGAASCPSPAPLEAAIRSTSCPDLALVWMECTARPHASPWLLVTCSLVSLSSPPETRDVLRRFVDRLGGCGGVVQRAEMVMVCPCPIPNMHVTTADLQAEVADCSAAQRFHCTGVTTLLTAFKEEQFDAVRREVLEWWTSLRGRILALRDVDPAIVVRFQEVTERDAGRFDVSLPIPAAGPLQTALAEGPWMALVHAVLGATQPLGCGLVVSTPGAGHQYWHSDGPHLGHPAEWEGSASTPYAVCVFVPLVDLTDRTGFTQFWPGSHSQDKLASRQDDPFLPGEWNGSCPAGSAIVYDFRIIHRGTPNHSDSDRPVLYFLYGTPGFSQDYNFGTLSIFDATVTDLLASCEPVRTAR